MNSLAEQYPKEIEFYVPQLCTYLFHFSKEDVAETWQLIKKEQEIEEEGVGGDIRLRTSTGSNDNLMKTDSTLEGAVENIPEQ